MMRHIVLLSLLISACTVPNPGLRETPDLATPRPDGDEGSGGNGLDGAVRPDLSVPVQDMRPGDMRPGDMRSPMDMTHRPDMKPMPDMARPPDMRAPDMGRPVSVNCGAKDCSGAESACCWRMNALSCVAPDEDCDRGRLLTCDGPEDCSGMTPLCCSVAGVKDGVPGTHCMDSCPAQEPIHDPLCHTLADCPIGKGYMACCTLQKEPMTAYRSCSKTRCP